MLEVLVKTDWHFKQRMDSVILSQDANTSLVRV